MPHSARGAPLAAQRSTYEHAHTCHVHLRVALVFGERIREEHRSGRSMISALEAGFDRAFATIIDSNVTMFLAAALLFMFGSGPVRGFAVTMILGIITTVVTAVTMTRMMIAVWYRTARPTHLPF